MVSPDSVSDLIESLRALVRLSRYKTARSAHLGMLPPPMGALLSQIACAAGHRPSAVAEDLRVTQSALSRQIAHAESLGYVVRTPDPLDGRATLLSLSDAGVEALRVHRQAQLDWIMSMMTDWNEDDVLALTASIDKLRDAVASELAPARTP